MPIINIRVGVETNDEGFAPAKGSISFSPIARRVEADNTGSILVLPKGFEVTLDADGKASVNLDETSPSWCWRAVESWSPNTGSRIWYFTVGADDDDYTTLTEVDKADFEPLPATASWSEQLAEVQDQVAELVEQFITVTDNNDGTVTLSGASVTDNNDGTLTIGA